MYDLTGINDGHGAEIGNT